MSAFFGFLVLVYAFIFCFGNYVMMGAEGRRKTRQAIKYVYVALKMAVAVAVSPLLVLLFIVSPTVFLPVFTFLWVHLDILREDKSLYLRRFFMTPKTQWFRPHFLHLIDQSDTGRDPHSHPDKFRTTILRGGYEEAVYYPGDQKFRTAYGLCHYRRAYPGDTLDNPPDHTHMVRLFSPTWSWVVGWQRGKKWGFWVLDSIDASKDRWVESETYGAKGAELKSWIIRQ